MARRPSSSLTLPIRLLVMMHQAKIWPAVAPSVSRSSGRKMHRLVLCRSCASFTPCTDCSGFTRGNRSPAAAFENEAWVGVSLTGKSPGGLSTPLSSPFCKNILVFRNGKSVLYRAVPLHWRGVAQRHETRSGMRWTLSAALDGRLRRRTEKSCGPDAPVLASSSREGNFR